MEQAIPKKHEISSYRKRIIGGLIGYGILSLGVIPIFTIWLGTRSDPFSMSMSAMGNANGGMHFLFIIWTILFCSYFASFVGYLLMLTKNTHSKIRFIVSLATLALIFGNIVPFLPDVLPGFTWFHNFCAQFSSVSLAIILMLFTLTLRNHYSALFKKALVFVLIIWATMIALMAILNVTSFTEMTGIIIAGVFLFTVLVWLYKEDTFDPVQSLKENDALEAVENAKKLSKKADAAKKEYVKLEAEARRAKIEADESVRQAKHHKKI
ncbi:MAG: hypothetical protein RR449_06670 [Christensenella sp.]